MVCQSLLCDANHVINTHTHIYIYIYIYTYIYIYIVKLCCACSYTYIHILTRCDYIKTILCTLTETVNPLFFALLTLPPYLFALALSL